MSEPNTPAGRLWIAPSSARFFLVDDTAPRVEGPSWVADLDSGEARIALEHWARHEVTESVAQAHYRAQLAAGAEVLQSALGRTESAVGAALPGLDALLNRLGGPDAAALDGPEALSLLSGRSRAEVEADPKGSRDTVLNALNALAGPEVAGSGAPAPRGRGLVTPATPEEREALGEILQRWTFGAPAIGGPADAPALRPQTLRSPRALLASLQRALAGLGQFETTESREDRLARYRTDARAAIDRATAGWKPPTPTVEELLRMGDDQ